LQKKSQTGIFCLCWCCHQQIRYYFKGEYFTTKSRQTSYINNPTLVGDNTNKGGKLVKQILKGLGVTIQEKHFSNTGYKDKIQQVSVWTEDDRLNQSFPKAD